MNNNYLMEIVDYIEEIKSLIHKLTSSWTDEHIANKAFEYTDKIMDILRKEYEKQLGPT